MYVKHVIARSMSVASLIVSVASSEVVVDQCGGYFEDRKWEVRKMPPDIGTKWQVHICHLPPMSHASAWIKPVTIYRSSH